MAKAAEGKGGCLKLRKAVAKAAEGKGGCFKLRKAVAKAAEGGAARLSGSDDGEGKRSDWDGEAEDGGGGLSKAKLPTADRS